MDGLHKKADERICVLVPLANHKLFLLFVSSM